VDLSASAGQVLDGASAHRVAGRRDRPSAIKIASRILPRLPLRGCQSHPSAPTSLMYSFSGPPKYAVLAVVMRLYSMERLQLQPECRDNRHEGRKFGVALDSWLSRRKRFRFRDLRWIVAGVLRRYFEHAAMPVEPAEVLIGKDDV